MWQVGDSEEISMRVIRHGLGGTGVDLDDADGRTADFIVYTEEGAGRQYLQSDLSTKSGTEHRHAMTWDGSKWDDGVDFVVPVSMQGETVTVEKTLWDTDSNPIQVLVEEHYVTAADLDTVEQQVIGPDESPTLDFG